MIKNSVIIGVGLMVLGSAFLSGKDGLVKSFLHQIDPFQIIWMQFSGTFMVMALIAFPMHGLRVFRPRPLGGQFLRGAMNICAVASLYWALTYIPLADATAMLLFAPAVPKPRHGKPDMLQAHSDTGLFMRSLTVQRL